ncbi:retrotransposon ty1-copia subclass [Ceraceosorus bombacis]|uniref:Retrotransposon ty1-copia subclass n=1 Tax=Ceraceosorus bombacis TaxID=401625 RepID=A0A0P1BK82_9BASI|nr:retrotransposon ty1-copia subclass [Ceraceosorus bombacis]
MVIVSPRGPPAPLGTMAPSNSSPTPVTGSFKTPPIAPLTSGNYTEMEENTKYEDAAGTTRTLTYTQLFQRQHNWDEADRKAMTMIRINVGPLEIRYLRDLTTAHASWKNITERYKRRGTTEQVRLLRQWQTLTMRTGETGEELCARASQMLDELDMMQLLPTPKMQAITLLGALDASYAPLAMSLETRDNLDFQIVESSIRQESARRNMADDMGTRALMARGQPKRPIRPKCTHCHKFGHVAKDCWEKDSPRPEQAHMADDDEDDHFEEPVGMAAMALDRSTLTEDWSQLYTPNVSTPSRASPAPHASPKYSPLRSPASTNPSPSPSGVATPYEFDDDSQMYAWSITDSTGTTTILAIDSGASTHMTNVRESIHNYRKLSFPRRIRTANGGECTALGYGDLVLVTSAHGTITLPSVLYVPGLQATLISVSRLVRSGSRVVFEGEMCTVIDKQGSVAVQAHISSSNVYAIDASPEQAQAAEALLTAQNITSLWHARLAHAPHAVVRTLCKGGYGVNVDVCELDTCDTCYKAKSKLSPFLETGAHRESEILARVHSDVSGPYSTPGLLGARYFVVFVDDFSRMAYTVCIKNKDDVLPVFKTYKLMMEKATGKDIKKFRSDNGGEYDGLKPFLLSQGITIERSPPKRQALNGVAERMIQTIRQRARSMMLHAKLPKHFWSAAIDCATYLTNRLPSAANNDMTPVEKWSGDKPNLSFLRVFGSTAYVHIDKSKRASKFSETAEKCTFIGYAPGTAAYWFWSPERHKVIVSRDARILELEDLDDVAASEPQGLDSSIRGAAGSGEADQIVELAAVAKASDATIAPSDTEPRSYKEAMASVNAQHWKDAMATEISNLKRAQSFEVVDNPTTHAPVSVRWVCKVKRDHHGEVIRYGARLVARGDQQTDGIDYEEIFAPVSKLASIRIFIALVASWKWFMVSFDFVCAFLNAPLETEVFCKIPEGAPPDCGDQRTQSWSLKRSLYGLKQSGRNWYNTLVADLEAMGFERNDAEPCLFYHSDMQVMIAVYVDDVLMAAKSRENITKIHKWLSAKYEMTGGDDATFILGIQILRASSTAGLIALSQQTYIENILARTNMLTAKPAPTPLSASVKLSKSQCPLHDDKEHVMTRLLSEDVCRRK